MLKKMIGGFLVILMGIGLTGCIDVKQKTGKVDDGRTLSQEDNVLLLERSIKKAC